MRADSKRCRGTDGKNSPTSQLGSSGLRLRDSNAMESDDVSGVCELPLQDLTLDDNKMHWREYRLQGETARTDVKGILEWEIGHFPRAPDRAKRNSAQTPWTQGTAIARRNKLLTRSRFKRNTVPDPYLLSGILGITIHQCINVEVNKPNKKSMSHVNFRGTTF